MAVIARRVVDGVEYAAVPVYHRFTLEEAVAAVLAAHEKPAAGPLSARAVRSALKRAAREHRRLDPIEQARTGPPRVLAARIRAELVRAQLFGAPAGGPDAHVGVSVEHLFTLDETTLAVMTAKSTVRPGPGRKIVPLAMRDVRTALRFSAREGPSADMTRRLRAEHEAGALHLLADWVRAELVRLRIFSAPASE